jgi:hypothetical protein
MIVLGSSKTIAFRNFYSKEISIKNEIIRVLFLHQLLLHLLGKPLLDLDRVL